ncbi:hypothetical protein [Winogradskyella pacifica]|uniref:hypothetical protein n=1 Tax=Winogradskyella pacifica TaxID=664642 RepID=UPI0015C83D2C|nr:hypothetical protein [Winogradskyella pacifica]
MKTLFKITVLMLITSFQVYAQTETETETEILYSKSYETNQSTTALLEFRGSSVEIYKSPDDKFHIEYIIEFINYPNRKKKEARERVNIESDLVNNQITLVDKSKFSMYRFYQSETITGTLDLRNESEIKSYLYKSEKQVVNEINKAKKPVSLYAKYIQSANRYSESEKKEMIEKSNNRKRKKYVKRFTIKVPSHLDLTINSKASTIRIQEKIENQITLRADGGTVYLNEINNIRNIIKIKDATLIVNSINGGEVILDNSKRTIIGELKNVKLNSEFSQLEIGLINKNVEITDFTSKYLIHNFSKDFEALDMNTEYSEVNLFLPRNGGYELTTFGNYTKHFVENKLVEVSAEKTNGNTKMLDLNSKENDGKLSAIKVNTANGIIRISKDVINFGE